MSSAVESEFFPVRVRIYDVPDTETVTGLAPQGEATEFPDVITFSYYETLYDPFVSATVTLFDSTGVFEELYDNKGIRPLCPVEVLFIDPLESVSDSGREVKSRDFSGDNCFFVKRISDQIVDRQKKMYTLELTTKDALASLATTIKRSWPADSSTGIDYNTVISDILSDYISTAKDTSEITTEMSESVYKIPGHNRRPYEIINDSCSKATPKASQGASGQEENRPAGYMFWETFGKYNFRSLYKLMTELQNVGEERKYKSVPVTVSDASDEEKVLNIISYVHSSNAMESDVYEQIMSGARTKRVKMLFDTSLNSFKKIESGVPEPLKNSETSAPVDVAFMPVTYLSETEYMVQYYNSSDNGTLDNEPTNPEHTSINYGALLEAIRRNTSTIKIPGHLGLQAGDHIIVNFPNPQGIGGLTSNVPTSNKYSGFYLITKLRHYTEDIVHVYTELEICKTLTQ